MAEDQAYISRGQSGCYRTDAYAAGKLKGNCVRILYYYQSTYNMLRRDGDHCTHASCRCNSHNVQQIPSSPLFRAMLHQFHRIYSIVIGIDRLCKMVTSPSLSLHNTAVRARDCIESSDRARDSDASHFQLLRTSVGLFLSSYRKFKYNYLEQYHTIKESPRLPALVVRIRQQLGGDWWTRYSIRLWRHECNEVYQ